MRYLTRARKELELKTLKRDIKLVDPMFLTHLTALNKIDGLVTMQSCIGHSIKQVGVVYKSSAMLWIYLSESMSDVFYRNAFKLSKLRGIERLSTYYTQWGEQYVIIEFASMVTKRGKATIKKIVEFFEFLGEECDGNAW